jgi:hypothetical protein
MSFLSLHCQAKDTTGFSPVSSYARNIWVKEPHMGFVVGAEDRESI